MNDIDRINPGELRLLAAINHGAVYGLDMQRFIHRQLGLSEPPSLGAIYTQLKRMEKKGWIVGQWGNDRDMSLGARRRNFSWTTEGRLVFERWKELLRTMLEPAPETETDNRSPGRHRRASSR